MLYRFSLTSRSLFLSYIFLITVRELLVCGVISRPITQRKHGAEDRLKQKYESSSVLMRHEFFGTQTNKLSINKNIRKVTHHNFHRSFLDIKTMLLDEKKCTKSILHVTRYVDHRKIHPAGIACYCDEVYSPMGVFVRNNVLTPPRFIFVATKVLEIFAFTILPKLKNKIVLLSGINDFTFPINYDVRFGVQDHDHILPTAIFNKLVTDDRIIHWFIENLSVNHSKVSPLPIGIEDKSNHKEPDGTRYLSPDSFYRELLSYFPLPPWTSRSLLVLSMDRVRDGVGQWADRKRARDLCKASSFCTTGEDFLGSKHRDFNGGSTHGNFKDALRDAKFTVMVHGGGFDPCPKLFESIILGSVPIIEESPVASIYRLPHFPVAVVPSIDSFLKEENSEESLKLIARWTKELSPYFMNETLRNETLSHLTEEYWWSVVESKYVVA